MDEAIVTTSWDDGHPADLRLAELLNNYDIPATFYIPIHNSERERMSPRQISQIAQAFDVGVHGYHHVNLAKIPPTEVKKEIIQGKKALEGIIGKEVFSFSYPWGAFNRQIMNTVKEAGFIGARTTKSLTRIIREPFAMGATVNATDWWFAAYVKHSVASRDMALFLFMLRNNLFFKRWHRLAIETLGFVIKNGGVWHLWGHSWEIHENSDWGMLEEVLREISAVSKKARRANNSQLISTCVTW